jgi:hypothetical protein
MLLEKFFDAGTIGDGRELVLILVRASPASARAKNLANPLHVIAIATRPIDMRLQAGALPTRPEQHIAPAKHPHLDAERSARRRRSC